MGKRGRRIIVSIAASADGYIARRDGSVDWLDRPRAAGDYGMGAFLRSIDTVVWGRRTYDQAVAMGRPEGFGSAGIRNYVFTHRPGDAHSDKVEFVNEPAGAFAARVRAAAGKDVWLMGGAGLIASFLDAGEIDEFLISVIPTFIGEGIPLIEPRRRTVPLGLVSSRRFRDGVVVLRYRVGR